MLEGRPSLADPRLEGLLRRLQTNQEQWYRRGHEDGTAWAFGTATREELFKVTEELGGETGDAIARRLHHRFGPVPWFPESFKVNERLARWYAEVATDVGGGRAPETEPPPESGSGAGGATESITAAEETRTDPSPVAGAEQPQQAQQAQQARLQADEGAYLAGWRDAVTEIWRAISPGLRS